MSASATAPPLRSPAMTWEFRSDTFTRPDAAMRRAMAEAEVGDDVWGEDPTVHLLEERAAAAVGKEAALLVPSGTMGNAIGVRLHAGQGDGLYVHERAHVVENEGGGPAALWGVLVRALAHPRGMPDPAHLLERVPTPEAAQDPHVARPRLAWIEQTVGAAGGAVWPLDHLRAYVAAARERGLAVHVDGARLFNAAVALGVPAATLVADVDTVQFCLSKGLGAPVGSVIAGDAATIQRARRLRKLLGGGMRQAGVIAAAGLLALERVDRLADDHANARELADGLAACARVAVDPAAVASNMVLATAARPGDDAATICRELAAVGVLASKIDPRTVRFVLCSEVDRAGVRGALSAAAPVLR